MRLDLYLSDKDKDLSRTQAQNLIKSGMVQLNISGQWQIIKQTSYEIDPNSSIEIKISEFDEHTYVSRAGLKLQNALQHTGLAPTGFKVLDIGQSTGGFSDCLLQKGAALIVGVEVGSQQLHPKIRNHAQVICLEKINARDLFKNESFTETYGKGVFDLAVCDVSFISFTYMMDSISFFLKPNGQGLCLIKPQFEVGPENLTREGIVKDDGLYSKVKQKIESELKLKNFDILDYFTANPTGKDGNIEFFVHFRKVI